MPGEKPDVILVLSLSVVDVVDLLLKSDSCFSMGRLGVGVEHIFFHTSPSLGRFLGSILALLELCM